MPERRAEGQGSGFIVDASGYVVTNNHVVDGAERILVTLQDGRQLDATLIGTDPKTDLALIKVDESGLPHVEFGDSSTARVGDWVVAIGNPFGLGGTATAGIISARGRDIQSGPYDDYLQIDAPINQGNSGGPVFNARGDVIGVNTAIYSPTGGNVGIGFAIPANQAQKVIAELREDGVVERGWLGVQIQDMDEALAESLGLDGTEGALVAEVLDGPAQRGGIQAGDVITRFDGQAIDSARALSTTVADADPSKTVNVTVWRNGENRELSVQLGQASATEMAEAVPRAPGERRGRGAGADSAVGLTLRALTDQDKAQLGVPGNVTGALVTAVSPDSPAAQKGIRAGDVIMQVDGQSVASADAAVAALNAARSGDGNALLLVRRGDTQRYVGLKFS
jgi:serine protease Do